MVARRPCRFKSRTAAALFRRYLFTDDGRHESHGLKRGLRYPFRLPAAPQRGKRARGESGRCGTSVRPAQRQTPSR
jgi:hypothetical protein